VNLEADRNKVSDGDTICHPTVVRQGMSDDQLLTPVRMLAQYAYCPRLAYLEWVQKEWADNYFTEDGRFTHRRVDAYSEAVDAPTTRSMALSAPDEGLVTKLDVLEQEDGVGVPVEYKRGKTPSRGPRRSEMVQLCAQGLVLRENGWKSERGFLYYSGSKQRVEVPFDEELVDTTRRLHEEMHLTFERGKIPVPLVNDARCEDCSLSAICLPEEVNFLKQKARSVRPLWAAHEEGHPLHVTEAGSKVGISGDELTVTFRKELVGKALLMETSEISLHGNVQLTTQAVRACARVGIPIAYFSYGNWFTAGLQGLPHKNVELRQCQFRTAFNPIETVRLARAFVASKIANQRVLLRRNGREVPAAVLKEMANLKQSALGVRSLKSLLGIEGLAARHYFESFPRMLKIKGVKFETRNRRPPADPINAVLSFCYSLLCKEATICLHQVGLDPYQGYLHQPRYGRPSLALDLMEEFRPLIADSVTLRLFNEKRLTRDDFFFAGIGCTLKKNAKKTLITAFEQRMSEELTHPVFGYKASYRRCLTLQARLLARYLTRELDSYPGLETR